MSHSSIPGRFVPSSCGWRFARTAPEAFREAIARNLHQAQLLVDEVAGHSDLELLTDAPALSIVPFRHVPAGVADLNSHNATAVHRAPA